MTSAKGARAGGGPADHVLHPAVAVGVAWREESRVSARSRWCTWGCSAETVPAGPLPPPSRCRVRPRLSGLPEASPADAGPSLTLSR